MFKNMCKTAMFLAPYSIQDISGFIYSLQYIHICHLIFPVNSLHSSPNPYFKLLKPLSVS